MELGCNTVNFRKMDLDYALEKIAEAGYEYVEVEANLKWCSHADPWKDDPVKFKDKVKSFGFKGVSAIGSHRELITSEQGVKDIKRALEWAQDAGVQVILTGEGRIPEGMSVENATQLAAKYNLDLQTEIESLPESLDFENSFSVNYDLAGYGLAIQRAKMLLKSGVIGYQEIKSGSDTFYLNSKPIEDLLEEVLDKYYKTCKKYVRVTEYPTIKKY